MATPSLPEAFRQAVTSHRWFAELPASAREAIIAHGRRRPLDSRAYLFREGDPSDGVYCVLAGTIELGRTTADSASLIDLYGVGSWIGETSSLLRLPRPFDARAAGRSEVLHLRQPELERLLVSQPALSRALLRLEASRVRLLLTALDGYATQSMEQRVANRVLLLIEAHGVRGETGWTIRVPLSQSTLAKLVGVTRQRVNQILGDWRERGLVELGRRRLVVLDRGALEQMVADGPVS